MTLFQEIQTKCTPAQIAEGNWHAIAEIVSIGRTAQVTPTWVSARTLLAQLSDGAAILDALQSASAVVSEVKWAMHYLTGPEGIDIGHPNSSMRLDQLQAGGILTAIQVASIKALANKPSPVTWQECQSAILGV